MASSNRDHQEKVTQIREASKKATRGGLVHLGTVFLTTFGLRDEDGNVIPQEAFQNVLRILKTGFGDEARKAAEEKRFEIASLGEGKKVVHLRTEFRANFGVEDEDGNIVKDPFLSGHFNVLSRKMFDDAEKNIIEFRDNLKTQLTR